MGQFRKAASQFFNYLPNDHASSKNNLRRGCSIAIPHTIKSFSPSNVVSSMEIAPMPQSKLESGD
jgi:hypothetical protein